jgi:hypothetical protein
MIAATVIALWLGASVLVGWLAGRFIRAGMVDLQRSNQVQETQP